MHVLILTPVFPHSGSPTEGLFNEQHALALTRAGNQVTIVVCKPWLPSVLAKRWRRYRSLARLTQPEEQNGMVVRFARYLHIPQYHSPQLTVSSCVHSILRAIRSLGSGNPFDIVQVHSSWPVGLAAPTIARSVNRPFVITMHIQDDPRLFGRGKGASLYKRMIEKASAVVVVGKPLERFIRPWLSDFSGKPLQVVPNGIDLGVLRGVLRDPAPKRKGWGHIVSVGNLWPTKGTDLNLEALAHLRRVGIPWESYTVIGDGPERRRLEKPAHNLDIGEHVFFKGRMPHQEVLKEIEAADIFSLPSWQEAFGVVYLEAMACGKPVIGCRGQGAEDIVRHGTEGLLVKAMDVEELAAGLSRLLTDHVFARRLGEAGVMRARAFTWEQNAEQYVGIYSRLVEAQAGIHLAIRQ